jgi:acetyltransferase-like isoleucine patch superfamily enzyme
VRIWYKIIFKQFGNNSLIISPLKINGAQNISIGHRVVVQYKTWLAAVPHTGEVECNLTIGVGTNIGHFNHIYCTHSIKIGKNVLTADKVYISDNLHGYEDLETPILRQPIVQKPTVEIGDDSWIGENVCIIGACIGRHCVIGANAVVTKDIPDYSVAVGNPARVIKQYNFKTEKWERVY